MIRFSVLFLLGALAACSGPEVKSDNGNDTGDFRPDPQPMAKTMVYECTGLEFVARRGPGEMAIWVGDRYLILSQVRSASGVKYQEGDVIFWSKGDELLVEVASERYSDCTLNNLRAPWEDARRRGVDFRATGNEPGWHLEVREGQHLLFVGDYGAVRVLLENPERSEEGGKTYYRAGDELSVTVSDTPCTDTMKGSQYPATVEVLYKGKFYQGCGMQLEHPWR